MWHEARKQERLIRGLIVDYRRRAERRKDFYEKIKAEPTQFLQLHGRQCKIHLDPAIALAGEGPAIMMPWQGDTTNMIDRFDVRAHLDYIPEVKNKDVPPEDLDQEERQCNYERYRILAQNVFLGIGEDKFLQQLAIEEQFGVTIEEKEAQKERLHEKRGAGAAIGYNYNDPGAQPSCSNGPEIKKVEQDDSDDDSDLEIIDVDLSIDVNKMEASQAHELNAVGPQYGMAGCDLFSFLTGDADDAEHQKQLLREEKEKAMFSGRKSRRERRAHRDKKLASRVVSPPSYAAPTVEMARSRSRSLSKSRSPEPDTSTAIQFITSFGDDDDPPPPKPLYADKLKQNLKKKELLYSDVARMAKSRSPKSVERRTYPQMGPHRPNSRSRSRSLSRSRSRSISRPKSRTRMWRKSRSKSRSYSRSRSASSRSRSRSKSYSPRRSSSKSRSGSRTRSYNYRNRRSRSPQNNASGYSKRNDSRSINESNDKGVNKAVPRYYGRRKEDKSSSDLSLDSDSSETSNEANNKPAVGNKPNTNQNQLRLSGSSSKGPSRETVTLKEKLKRKMQAQIAKQLRADKRAEAERMERENRRQARRDEEMRELAIKLRRKQREMRHQQNRRSTDDDSDRSRSGSSSREVQPKKKEAKSRSKSRSPDVPRPPRSPVWETKSDVNYKPKHHDEGESSQNYHRKRSDQNPEHYREERKMEEDRQNYNKYDRYPKRDLGERSDSRSEREYGERFEYPDRWETRGNFHPRGLRPYGPRGEFRDQSRHGPPNWNPRNDSRDHERGSPDEFSRGKVKLVDY